MKKTMIIVLAAALTLGFAGCSSNNVDTAAVQEEVASVNAEAESEMAADNVDYDNFDERFQEMESLRAVLSETEAEGETLVADSDKLIENSDTLRSYRDNAIECAKAYCGAFMESHTDATITKIATIIQMRQDSETNAPAAYYLFALTYTDGSGEHNVYSTAWFNNASIRSAMVQQPDMFYADAPISENLDALTGGNMTIDLEELGDFSASETTTAAAEETTAAAAEETTAAETTGA